ncbi:MAG: monovalent cation/H(+) antiporter subunit G [Actinomycetota bacterium]
MELISALFILLGSLFSLLASVGLHRFDDVFARMHAAGKASTLGMLLILIGVGLRIGDAGAWMKISVVAVLAIITIPAGVHVIARAAWRAGTELADATSFDDASKARFDGD